MGVVSSSGYYPTGQERTESIGDINIISAASGGCHYSLAEAASVAAEELVAAPPFQIDLTPYTAGQIIVPGSVCFTWGGHVYVDKLGIIYRDPSPTTGLGVQVGTIDYTSAIVTLDTYDSGSNVVAVKSLLTKNGHQFISQATFRLPGSPVKPQSFQFLGVAADGRQIEGGANASGIIEGTLCRGACDYEQGIVLLMLGEMVDAFGMEGETWYRAEDVVNGQIWRPLMAFADQFQYTCVVYSYIPLDPDIIGIDPVRLPPDGRVPIARVGNYVVIHNTQNTQLPQPLSAGQVITLPRDGIKLVDIYDSSEPIALRVPSTKYTWDRIAQTLTMATPLDLTGFTPPFIAMHRIEDEGMIQQVQINGQIIFNLPVQHDYPVDGTYVSTILPFGDLRARVYNLFDQNTWTNVWSDVLIGDAATASLDTLNYPIVVTNKGAINGNWALIFTDTTHFNIVEEKRGIIGSGYTTQDCGPINPATGVPYFWIDLRAWGAGWGANKVVRFKTAGACPHIWVARTTMPGPPTVLNDQFTLHLRGNAD